jgi:hypothetical protein
MEEHMVDRTQSLNPQILGQAERAHAALLGRILEGTSLTYYHWVALNLLAAAGEGRIELEILVERMAGALKIDDASARDAISELYDLRLARATSSDAPGMQLTDEGRSSFRRLRNAVDETVGALYADIPADDLATVGRVLALITARANAEFARAS